MLARHLAMIVLLASPLNTWAQQTPTRANKPESNQVAVTYPVADLVVPIGGLDYPFASGNEEEKKTKEAWLMDKITRSIASKTWADNGGTGTIQYYPLGMAIIVNQSPQIQAQVKDLLETMRRAQNIEVLVEIKLVTVSSGLYSKLLPLYPNLKKDGQVILSPTEISFLLEKSQGDQDGDIFQAPKITVFPGQRARMCVGGTAVDAPVVDAQLKAMVAGNLHHVDLDLKGQASSIKFEKTASFAEGNTLALAARKDGNTHIVLLVTPRVIINSQVEERTKIYNPIPRVGVYPQALAPDNLIQAGATAPSPAPNFGLTMPPSTPAGSRSANPQLAKILQKYEAACAAGDQTKARKLAVRGAGY